MKKLSIDIADWNGFALRRLLCSAERLSERAIFRGDPDLKTPCSKSIALLVSATFFDYFFLFLLDDFFLAISPY